MAPFRTPVTGNTSSVEVFQQAMAWCSKCKCANTQPKWHPTRLIDLRNLKAKVQLEGTRRIVLKERLGWETSQNEVVRLVEKGDDDFPQTGLHSKNEMDDPGKNVDESNKDEFAPRPQKIYNRYVTLSHCWGEHRPKVLEHATKHELRRGIKIKDLPKTYREAIQFAAQMEDVGWIWIDSLCIMQDDATDWTNESSQMQRVYKESFLNISATASPDSTAGLYRDRLPKALWEHEVNLKVDGIYGLSKESGSESPTSSNSSLTTKKSIEAPGLLWLSAIYHWIKPLFSNADHVDQQRINSPAEASRNSPVPQPEGVRRCILLDVSHWDDIVNSAPVNTRAWVLQERLLASRVLHFSNGQVGWECSEFEEAEGYPTEMPKYLLRNDRILPKPLKKGLVPDQHGRELRSMKLEGKPEPDAQVNEIYAFELWSSIVEDYSRLNLTEGRDKLVALSGIAELVAKQVIGLGSTAAIYHAGLWEKYLASQLLWKVEPIFTHHSRTFENLSRRPKDSNGNLMYRAPSYSWASVDAQYGNGVTYGEITDQDLFIEVHTGSNSVSITHKVSENLYGEVEGGHVMIWAQIRRIKLLKEDKGRYYWLLQDRSDVCHAEESRELEAEAHRNVYLDCPMDDEEHILDADNVYCIPAALGSRTDDKESKYIICLLLQHISEGDGKLSIFQTCHRSGVYRRIGLTKLSPWTDKFAYRYIRKPLSADRDYPQWPCKYGNNGEGRSLITVI